MARFPPMEEAGMTPAQREVAAEIAAGPRGEVRGPFVPLLRSPPLVARLHKVGEYLRFGCALPQHIVELAVLVTARACAAPYEWHAHYPLGLKAGLPAQVADAVGRGEAPETGDAAIQAAHDFAFRLNRDRAVDDATFSRARDAFGEQGVIELVAICGYYGLIGMVLNAAEIRPPADGPAAPFPAAVPR